MAGMEDDTGIYPYQPNGKICIVAAILFGGSAFFHLWQMLRKRTWFYTPLLVGAVMMTFGYIARSFSAKSPAEVMPYIAQSLLIILPPSLYAATIYMIYGRIAIFVNVPGASIIRPARVTKIFVVGDVVAFLMQAGGGGMMAQSSMANTGQKVILLGLFVQLVFFGFFLFVALIFYKRMRSSPVRYTTPSYGKHTWVQLIKLLFAAAAIIILRCVFRVIEFGQGHSGYLAAHEVYMYIFDAVPMFLVQALFHLVHAGDVIPANIVMEKLDDNISDANIGLRQRT
ncbi:RTA1 like protein-domain-containing protein [Cadophora sp. MPI-SDFR-AT-0126]|nr:RTA1 like protein-domain-containing protein [Leotiomycetes sp. MPI-SDFR-AT-0126]